METAIVSLICIALVVFGGMTMSRGFLTSVDVSTMGLEEAGVMGEAIMRTELSVVSTSLPASNLVDVTLENSGQTKLADFNKWDVIVQYRDSGGSLYVKWLPYTGGTLGDNEWNVQWIHLNGGTEVFEPNVLNPGEEIKVRARLNPSVGAGTTNQVVISTPNGIRCSAFFSP